ncbi:MAG TPA: DNA polymerase I [Bacteroidota bacterium]|nr:DNA polymerase I [Bacteroidota bacterium]
MAVKKSPAKTPPERLFLLDGMALAYRAYFSFIGRPLINSRGENTSAIFGFVNTLMKILTVDRPEHIAVVFDTKEPTFRHRMFGAYKATREKMPEDLAGQLDKLKEVVRAFNVPGLELPGFEADDVMGTLARMAERSGIETWLVTGDKDFMQLISPLIRMYKPGKQGDDWEVLDEKAVAAKFGVRPALVTEVLAIVGDKSDNVPGVRGIGDKTAIPLVQEYETLENLYRNLEHIPQKGVRQKLAEGEASAYLSRKLVTIDTSAPVSEAIDDLVARPPDVPKLRQLFAELEFRALLKKFEQEGPGGSVRTGAGAGQAPAGPFPAPGGPGESAVAPVALGDITTVPHRYVTLTKIKNLREVAAKLRKAKLLAVDTETTSTDALRAELVGISLATDPGNAWYVPVLDDRAHIGPPGPEQGGMVRHPERPGLPWSTVSGILGPVLADPGVKKAGQNIKYDMLVLGAHGVEMAGIQFDTMVASYILRPDGAHNMDALASEHLRYRTITYDDLTGTGRNRKDIRDVEPERVAEYAAEDADVTLRLCRAIGEKLDPGMTAICHDIEFPLIEVLARMEMNGVALDTAYLADLSKELERNLDNLTRSIYHHAGCEFNVNSTQQLGKILFEKLSLPTARKTKTGFSTDVGVLESLRHGHPIVEQLLEYRQLQKLKSTYVDALPTLVNPATGRLHTSYNQAVALTGRLSSSDPNLQNIPIRTELGGSIRKAFVPGAKRCRILSADYSQIELRIMAHVCADEGLTAAFRNGEDIHTTTASGVFGVRASGVTKEMRRKAKEVNFGIMYGIGPFGLASRLDISQGEAKEIILKYFERFPKVKEYITGTIESARKNGFAATLLGRKRFFPDINSRNFPVRSNAERQAINMPIQGTAADMIKLAMIRIHGRLTGERLRARMLLQVHDELVFEVPESETDAVGKLVRSEMEAALPLSVPVVVDVGTGKNWL